MCREEGRDLEKQLAWEEVLAFRRYSTVSIKFSTKRSQM
jgi:hypothetical protein